MKTTSPTAPASTGCAHCGHSMRGSASVDGQRVCHTSMGALDCYRLVTIYDHPMPCADCAKHR